MSVILSTFLPSEVRSQYWFINGNQDYFELGVIFRPLDFLYIDQCNPCFLEEEIIEELHTFLLKMDSKGVKWLVYIPVTDTVEQFFSRFHFHIVPDRQTFNDNIKLICIANYPVKI